MQILKPWAVYNEIEEYAADWIENLIAAGLIAPGIVDRRSIVDVQPDDYRGFRQAHFFAGIGVWSYALRRAGVSDDTALWTGSCPCQPFSAAGAGGGVDDERHLWPHWFHLIAAVRPSRVYGEQVASKDGLGWLDLVSSDLEGEGYSIWSVDTCSAGSGAPHLRQRIRFCADDLRSAAGGMANNSGKGLQRAERHRSAGAKGAPDGHCSERGGTLRVADTEREQRQERLSRRWEGDSPSGSGATVEPSGLRLPCGLADVNGGDSGAEWEQQGGEQRQQPQDGGSSYRTTPARTGPTNGVWGDADWLFCRDGKWRPVEPGTFPMVDGAAFNLGSGSAYEGKSRQGMLKGYGNAIDAEATIDFIEATLEPDTIEIALGADAHAGDFEDLLG